MNTKYLLAILFLSIFNSTYAVERSFNPQFKYIENKKFWESVDEHNNELSLFKKDIPQKSLSILFLKTIEIFQKPHFMNEFENFRTEAFELDDFRRIEYFVERSKPSYDVAIMGEPNNIGINIHYFLNKCSPENAEYAFFNLAKYGFYIKSNGFYLAGISEFPVWMKRTGSSFQGNYVKEVAGNYLNKWKIILTRMKGIYRTIALDTTWVCGE